MDIGALLDNGAPVQVDTGPSTTMTAITEEQQEHPNETQVQADSSASVQTVVADDNATKSESVVDTRCFAALFLREVLSVILAHSDNCTTARAARVNSHWSEVALDLLYRRSPDLFDLVSILAPISDTYFSRELVPSDWARFAHYAPRVHTLSHDTTGGSHSSRHLSESLFQEMALSRPNLLIFPNLHTLTWTVSRHRFLRAALIFFQPSVPLKNLTLNITRLEGAKTFDYFLQTFGERVPNLETFSLDIPRPVGEYTNPFVSFLTNSRSLKSITLPHFFLSNPVLESLAILPHLESITLRKRDHIGTSADVTGSPICIPSLSSQFQSLHHLSIDCNLNTISSFIVETSPRLTLKSLHVSSTSLESPNAIHTFLQTLSQGTPNLETLMLALLTLSVTSPAHPTEINFQTLSPIFAIPKLEAFGITYNYPLALTSSDVDDFARSLPKIKRLFLCESSYDTHDRSATTLGLEVLISFAKHCPCLEELGIFIDAGLPSPPPIIPEGVRFSKLHTLSVGQSFMPQTGLSPSSSSADLTPANVGTNPTTSVALFLSRLLPALKLRSKNSLNDTSRVPASLPFDLLTGCTSLPHSFSPTYHEQSPHPESDDVFQERLNSWSEVRRITGVLLEVAREVAEEEKERANEREREREENTVKNSEEIQRLHAEISRLQLEVAELKRRGSSDSV